MFVLLSGNHQAFILLSLHIKKELKKSFEGRVWGKEAINKRSSVFVVFVIE